jgi:hypothetical protein
MSGYRTLWIFLLLGWTVSAADRALDAGLIACAVVLFVFVR